MGLVKPEYDNRNSFEIAWMAHIDLDGADKKIVVGGPESLGYKGTFNFL